MGARHRSQAEHSTRIALPMPKANKVTLPREWHQFVSRYGADRAYWYIPKGLAVSATSLQPRLKVLKEFEGGKPWRDRQQEYVQRLNDESISDAATAWDDGGAPLARMLKQVFVTLHCPGHGQPGGPRQVLPRLSWSAPNSCRPSCPAGFKAAWASRMIVRLSSGKSDLET
jgi:hypothetical protein